MERVVRTMSAIEMYEPLVSFVGFLGGWGLAMLTGVFFVQAS